MLLVVSVAVVVAVEKASIVLVVNVAVVVVEVDFAVAEVSVLRKQFRQQRRPGPEGSRCAPRAPRQTQPQCVREQIGQFLIQEQIVWHV